MEVGCIGVGGIAKRHLDNFENIDAANVVAVCDINRETADKVAAARDATPYYDHERMITDVDLDAVLIAIPPFAHTNQETLAAENSLGVFVEKPVALSIENSQRIGASIVEAGVVNQVGYALRYAESIQHARDLLLPRDVAMVEGRYTFPGTPSADWWCEQECSGGQVVEQSTHVYDTIRYLVGDVTQVYAIGNRRHVDAIDFEDTTMATMEHQTGVVSHVVSTCAAPSMNVKIKITGPDVDLTLDPIEDELTGIVEGETIDFVGESDAFVNELTAFVDAVENGSQEPVRCDYGDAIETLATTLAVNESIETGTPVVVDTDAVGENQH
ncbi:Gfo/Idh/MocA family protein [Haladaptatus sp. NG-SE-30]